LVLQRRPAKLDVESDDDEDLDSDAEEAAEQRGKKQVHETSDDENETAEQKRLRIAKKYLAEMGESAGGEIGESDDSQDEGEDSGAREDVVGQKLKRARLEATGGFRRELASSLAGKALPEPSTYRWMTGHTLSLTCLALSTDDRHAFTGAKDNAVIQYDVETGQRVGYLRRSWRPSADGAVKACHGEVLALAASSDGRLLASGGRDKLVRLYDLRKLQSAGSVGDSSVTVDGGGGGGGGVVGGMSFTSTGGRGTRAFEMQTFRGHKDAISGLVFQCGTGASTLFSASLDRTLKLWNVKDMGFMDTLYGHQSEVSSLLKGVEKFKKTRDN